MSQVFAAVAEFERHLIRERTSAGLAATRDRQTLGISRASIHRHLTRAGSC